MVKTPEQLIRAARHGNQQALLQVFDQHHLPLFRFAWRLCGSTEDAEDIVQDCFLALLRPDCGFDPARTPVRTYLFGAVRNQWLKRLRRRSPDIAADPTELRTPETETLRNEMEKAVADAIATLPDTQREVLLLAHYEQLSLADIAAITAVEITAVKSRLQRARAALKEILAAYAPESSGLYERQ